MSRRRYFTVVGRGSFPFKLLFLDHCYPATGAEAEKIVLACPTVAPEQTITLASADLDTPTISAWKEAGWPVKRAE